MTVLLSYNKDKALYLTHSRYYYQCVSNFPFAPEIYWNVVTDDDIIPVCTHGYKNEKSAQQQIKKYIKNIKEFRLIHIETEEESDSSAFMYASRFAGTLKDDFDY